jgi:hypothetical protein
LQNTIIGMDVPDDGHGSIQELAAFDAGPPDKIHWSLFDLPNYGTVLGFTAPSRIDPWMKFDTLSTHKRSKFGLLFKI